MPYTSIPTLSDGQILTASYLNLLSGNMGYLFGLANQANIPFNSYRDTRVTFDRNTMQWDVRHKLQYFHYKITSQGSNWNYCRVYYNGVKVAGMETAGNTFTGTFDLTTWAGLPNLVGAWASGVAYDDDVHGDGNVGNGDDGSVVTQGGSYYDCKLAHTSAAGNQPGVGASWTTYWNLLTLPGLQTMCTTWADVNFNTGQEMTVEYLVETDGTSF
jgi:hypothetical protein